MNMLNGRIYPRTLREVILHKNNFKDINSLLFSKSNNANDWFKLMFDPKKYSLKFEIIYEDFIKEYKRNYYKHNFTHIHRQFYVEKITITQQLLEIKK